MKIESSVSLYAQQQHGVSRSGEREIIKNNGQQIETERGEAQQVAKKVREQNEAITNNAIQQAEKSKSANKQANTTRENVIGSKINTYA